MATRNLSDYCKAVYYNIVAYFKVEDDAERVENARMSQIRLKALSNKAIAQPPCGSILENRSEQINSDTVCSEEVFHEVFGSAPVKVPTTSGARLNGVSQYRLAAYVASLPQTRDYSLHLKQ